MEKEVTVLFYPLADTLRMKLVYDPKTDKLTGESIRTFCTLGGLTLDGKLDIVSSVVDLKGKMAGVLCHVLGKLYVFLAYSRREQKLKAMVISAEKLNKKKLELVDLFPRGCTMAQALDLVSKGVVALWERQEYEEIWTTTKGSDKGATSMDRRRR